MFCMQNFISTLSNANLETPRQSLNLKITHEKVVILSSSQHSGMHTE